MDMPLDGGWRALVGVGVGYGIAVGLVFLLFFVVPYLVVSTL
jgi:hypothetical protein